MERRYRISKIGNLYIPAPIRDEIGREVKLVDAPGLALVFPQGVNIKRVLKGLELLKEDLKHRYSEELESEQGKGTREREERRRSYGSK